MAAQPALVCPAPFNFLSRYEGKHTGGLSSHMQSQSCLLRPTAATHADQYIANRRKLVCFLYPHMHG